MEGVLHSLHKVGTCSNREVSSFQRYVGNSEGHVYEMGPRFRGCNVQVCVHTIQLSMKLGLKTKLLICQDVLISAWDVGLSTCNH